MPRHIVLMAFSTGCEQQQGPASDGAGGGIGIDLDLEPPSPKRDCISARNGSISASSSPTVCSPALLRRQRLAQQVSQLAQQQGPPATSPVT